MKLGYKISFGTEKQRDKKLYLEKVKWMMQFRNKYQS